MAVGSSPRTITTLTLCQNFHYKHSSPFVDLILSSIRQLWFTIRYKCHCCIFRFIVPCSVIVVGAHRCHCFVGLLAVPLLLIHSWGDIFKSISFQSPLSPVFEVYAHFSNRKSGLPTTSWDSQGNSNNLKYLGGLYQSSEKQNKGKLFKPHVVVFIR